MLEIIVITILIATLLNVFLKKLEIPTIIGYILTGIIITQLFDLHEAISSKELKEIAEFGVVFLLFTIGLEFSIQHLKKMKKEVFLYGALQVILTAIVFSLGAHFIFGIEAKSSIIIGLALSLSSTAIVLKLLNETGDINKKYGKKTFGVLLFQDIAVIPILLMITIFSSTESSIGKLLGETFFNAFVLLTALYFSGKYLLEPFLHQVTKSKSNEVFIGSILLLVIGSSYLAHYFGFSYSLGAFIAGMLIAETHYKHQVEADLIPFRDLLLGVFFVTVGMQLNFEIIVEYIWIITLLLPTLILTKILIIYGIMRIATNNRNAIKVAITLFQLGEFALVIFELASARGIVEPVITQILIVIIVISMFLTPFIIKKSGFIADKINRTDEQNYDEILEIDKKGLNNHIILIGFGRLGKRIAKQIKESKTNYISIEHDINLVKEGKKQGFNVVYGNATMKEILLTAQIKKASSLIISIGNSDKIYHICEVIHSLHQDKKIIVKVETYEQKEKLEELGVKHIIVETEKTAQIIYEEAINI